jgi:glycerol dehydrogenase-like iron-containing ADH family enzyme
MADRHAPPVVITRPTPWRMVEARFGTEPLAVRFVTDLERATLQRLISEVPAAPVIGIGGGTAVEAAKWLAWQRSSPLWLVPSLPSVDASFMRTVAVREAGGVRYEGDARPAQRRGYPRADGVVPPGGPAHR